MKLSFMGLENTLDIAPGRVSVLQIESVKLFARICQSLLNSNQSDRLEDFSLWDDNGREVSAKSVFFPIVDPFKLPWYDRAIVAALYEQMKNYLWEDETIRAEVEQAHQYFEHLICDLSLRMNASYSFEAEWDLNQSLKAYSFGIDRSDSVSLLDNLIRFIELIHDIGSKKVLLFINLEKFLTEEELLELENQLFFHDLRALMLVQGSVGIHLRNPIKLFIDQEFLEYLM